MDLSNKAKNEFKQFLLSVPEKYSAEKNYRLTIAAGGMIFAHNKILLNRAESSDLWSIPGGVIKFEESTKQTIVRELKEELNLDISIIDTPPFIFHFTMESNEFFDMIYLVHFLVKVNGTPKIIMGEEVADYRWESIGSHFRDCYPNVKPAVDYFMGL